mgnify:CR=1 FL=1
MKSFDFEPIAPGDRDIFLAYQCRFPLPSCERGWANLRLYRDSYDWHFRIVDGRLITVSFRSGHVQFPLGEELPPAALATLLRQVAAVGNWNPGCYDMPEAYLDRHPDWEAFFTIEFDPGEADYIYQLDHLIALDGARLRKKHNLIRQFERDCAGRFQVIPVASGNLPEILDFADRLNRMQEPAPGIVEENLALRRLAAEFADPGLALGGIVLMVDRHVAGFSIYSPLSPELADIHFEKADRRIHGSGAKLTYELARSLRSRGFVRMNREQDLNDSGLRQAKHSLDPEYLYRRGNLEVK